jgi:chemotaxis protein MotB
MPKPILVTAGLISVVLLLALAALQIHQSSQAREQAEAALRQALADAEAFRATNSVLAGEVTTLQEQSNQLEARLTEASQARDGMLQKMQSELESKDITITELQGKLTVNILDRVLFDSGQATLKSEGQAVLLKVAQVLSQYPKRSIQVVGHTDNVPIRVRTVEGFTDNWSLSAGRALAAVRFLVDQAKVDPRRLSAVGCGEFKPVADNSTVEGRSRNRRIAVVVLPEEWVGSDAVAAGRTTNSVPGKALGSPTNAVPIKVGDPATAAPKEGGAVP